MAPTSRRAGQFAREKTRRLAIEALVVLAVIVLVTVIAGLVLGFGSLVFMAFETAAIVAIVVIDRVRHPVIDRWHRGATGEEHVGRMLDSLEAEGWHAVHDVCLGRGNVDHVLVGPGGLLTIETKSHGGRIHARSVEPGMLSQAWAQRKLVERVTGLTADPLLVFSRGFVTPAVSRQRGVLVLSARMLKGHLARRPVVLSRREVEDLHERLTAAVA